VISSGLASLYSFIILFAFLIVLNVFRGFVLTEASFSSEKEAFSLV
jgi:hypothetical protein